MVRLFTAILLSFLGFFPCYSQEIKNISASNLEVTLKSIGKIKQIYPNSILADTQIELELNKLTTKELLAMKKAIPSPWSATELSFLAMNTGINKHIDNLTEKTIELGRIDGNKNWKNALQKASDFKDINEKRLYLIGILTSAGRLESFQQAEILRAKILPQLSHDQQHTISCYRGNYWLRLWPSKSIAAYGKTLSEDKNFSLIRSITESGNMYFSHYKEGEKYLQHFGRSAPGQAPTIGESMGKVLAARNPKQFIEWFKRQNENMRSFVIPDAIEPLLRNDPSLIQDIIPHFKNSHSFTSMEIAREWARYEPDEAKKWARSMPIFKRFGESFVFRNSTSDLPNFETYMPSHLGKEQYLKRPTSIKASQPNIDHLTNLANPGASPIANNLLYQHVFSLNPQATKQLFHSLVENYPKNAKQILVRRYLLESWILYEPETACDWILSFGDGRMRSLLPLAFVHMKKQDIASLKKRLNKIPETSIYRSCLQALKTDKFYSSY